MRVTDWEGEQAEVDDTVGLVTVSWSVGVGTIGYAHKDGTVHVPSDCQGSVQDYLEQGRCVGRWVNLQTGFLAVILDGKPLDLVA